MKYIKQFEDINIVPQIGDYVLMKERLPYVFDDDLPTKDLLNFIKNNIGIIEDIIDDEDLLNDKYIEVEYNNIPDDLYDYFSTNFPDHLVQNLLIFKLKHIKMFDKSKENIEARLSANKYNL